MYIVLYKFMYNTVEVLLQFTEGTVKVCLLFAGGLVRFFKVLWMFGEGMEQFVSFFLPYCRKEKRERKGEYHLKGMSLIKTHTQFRLANTIERESFTCENFTNLVVSGQFAKGLIVRIFIECGGIIINGCVIILDNRDHGCWIKDVGSLLLARQYLSKSSFPDRHLDMV